MSGRRRKPKAITAGQCVDTIDRLLARYNSQMGVYNNELYAVLDCVLRLRGLAPTGLRIPAEGE